MKIEITIYEILDQMTNQDLVDLRKELDDKMWSHGLLDRSTDTNVFKNLEKIGRAQHQLTIEEERQISEIANRLVEP